MKRVTKRRCSRLAITLVELIVVLGIFAILTVMLFPTVQTFRESSRRTLCLNKLRQLGVAMSNYESSRQHFPPGQLSTWTVNDLSRSPMLGHLGFILPFIEEGAYHSRFDKFGWGLDSQGPAWYSDANIIREANQQIPGLRCPSDYEDSQVRALRVLPSPGIQGSIPIEPELNFQGWTNYLGSMGKISFENGAIEFSGIFFSRTTIAVLEITDGLSNTILLGEVVGGFSRLTLERRTDMRNSIFQDGISVEFPVLPNAGHSDRSPFSTADFFDSRHHNGRVRNWGMCDGSVKTWQSSMDFNVLQSLVSRNGGELVEL